MQNIQLIKTFVVTHKIIYKKRKCEQTWIINKLTISWVSKKVFNFLKKIIPFGSFVNDVTLSYKRKDFVWIFCYRGKRGMVYKSHFSWLYLWTAQFCANFAINQLNLDDIKLSSISLRMFWSTWNIKILNRLSSQKNHILVIKFRHGPIKQE